jgi:hypothetical protein
MLIVASVKRGCCCNDPCNACTGGSDRDRFNFALTTPVTICSGCRDTASGTASFNLDPGTLTGEWCLIKGPSECEWQKIVTPSPITGNFYSGTGCGGSPTAATHMRVRAVAGAIFNTVTIDVFFGGSSVVLFSSFASLVLGICLATSRTGTALGCADPGNKTGGTGGAGTVSSPCVVLP